MRGFVFAVLLSGCAANVRYVARWSLAIPAQKFVAVQVENARPPEEGGGDAMQVGVVRNGFGMPNAWRQGEGDILQLVRAATLDALHAAGIEEQAGATNHLRARILTLWMDGYMGYAATVKVEYAVVGPDGQVWWQGTAEGHDESVAWTMGSLDDLIASALSRMASRANAQFKEPAFQSALRAP